MATGEMLSFEANRNNSGKYWCSADNGLSAAANASANLDVQCKFELTQYTNLFKIIDQLATDFSCVQFLVLVKSVDLWHIMKHT